MAKLLSMLLVLLPLLSGCASVSYYGQAISGHMSLMAERQPIQQLLKEEDLSGTLKERLILAQSIRDFASVSLELPDNDSYRSFVPLAGEAVVWSLVATKAYSVDPKQWCYPVIGCASYRGYFKLQQAERHKEKLEAEGLDVALEPVPAYSTLGWFDDPIPGSVIYWSDWKLAGLIFHELAHQRLYLSGDSAFNEAFANSVQQAGVESWLSANQPAGLEAWRLAQRRELAFIRLLLETRERLQLLYQSGVDEQQMMRGKHAEFVRLIDDYQEFKREWRDYRGYDAWFDRGLNNARLASIATYEAWVPAFKQLLKRAGGNFEEFYQTCEWLAELPEEERLVHMQQLRDSALQTGQEARTITAGPLPETAVQ